MRSRIKTKNDFGEKNENNDETFLDDRSFGYDRDGRW
jgi:hypothetical protein